MCRGVNMQREARKTSEQVRNVLVSTVERTNKQYRQHIFNGHKIKGLPRDTGWEMDAQLTLGLFVELSEVLPLFLVDDGEDSSDGFADSVAG